MLMTVLIRHYFNSYRLGILGLNGVFYLDQVIFSFFFTSQNYFSGLKIDLAGTPRYASNDWVNILADVNKKNGGVMRLAGHLCKDRCQEVHDTTNYQHITSEILLGHLWRINFCIKFERAWVFASPSQRHECKWCRYGGIKIARLCSRATNIC